MLKIFFFILLFPFAAQATVDFRLNLGRTFANPKSLNEGLPEMIHISGLSNIGFDLLVNPSFLPGGLGGGLRFDSYQTSQKEGDNEISYSGSSFTMLINYRLINTVFYAGPILGIGIGNSAKIETQLNGDPKTGYESEQIRVVTLGIEGGARVATLAFGGEMGYQYYKGKEFIDGNGNYFRDSSGVPKEADLGGMYLKVSCGFSF